MKHLCLYFQVHQPFRFRKYSFFDIGSDHYYYDDYLNESILQKVARNCYLPTNELLLKLIEKHGRNFKVTFSITGIALDQFELYAPEVIESFQRLAKTGQVEFLAETYSHSLASQANIDVMKKQVKDHSTKIEKLFGQKPKVFRNTELIYSDEVGAAVYKMGYKGMLTEGAKHILGWKSPNFLYYNAKEPQLKLLLRNYTLSDDISFRFCAKHWTADSYAARLNEVPDKEEIVNLFMDYETFGEHQEKETGIFQFLEHLPDAVLNQTDFRFATPSQIIKNVQPVAAINVPYPISWADEERDITAWLGNNMQNEAFSKLYALTDKVAQVKDPQILQDWEYLQTSDHFYYMSTKWFSDGEVHAYFNPYKTPYDAFINYMNVLTDFSLRVNKALPDAEIRTCRDVEKLQDMVLEQKAEIKKLKSKAKKA